MKKNGIGLSRPLKGGIKKLLLMTKLTIFLSLFFVVQLSANVYSQTRITVDSKNKTVKQVLLEIENQSEFRFFYNEQFIDLNRRVKFDINNETITNVMDNLFSSTNMTYKILENNLIVITPGDILQQKTVTGTVTDDTGLPLPGVTVLIKGTTQGTVTNVDGKYSIPNIPENAVLLFSFVGMKTQEAVVGNQTTINVEMVTDAIGIEEVVAIGYGTMRKSDLTGSVVRIDQEVISERPNISVIQSLQGSTPGLNIGQVNTAGGEPSLSIRGRTSISGQQSPLIVLDGTIFRGRLIDINPSDIKSIDILKDASSTAVYGSQATNGVIIIISKTGEVNKKPIINYSASYSFEEPTKRFIPESPEEYLQRIEATYFLESRTKESGYLEPKPNWNVTTAFRTSDQLKAYENNITTDWYNILTNDRMYTQNHNLSLTKRTDNSGYFLSIGYTDQAGYMVNEDYSRWNSRINIDNSITSWLEIGIQSFLTLSDYSGFDIDPVNVYEYHSYSPAFNEDGSYNLSPRGKDYNPLFLIESDDYDKSINLFGNIYADIDIPFIKGLSFKTNFNTNYYTTSNYYFRSYENNFLGTGRKNESRRTEWTNDNVLTYNNTFNDIHKVLVTLLYGREKRDYTSTTARASDFISKELGYNRLQAGDAGLQNVSSDAWLESSLYSMARLFYGFRNKYLFTGTVRRDGFSGFSEKNKFGVFPSLSVAWVLTEESFLKNSLKAFDQLKIRASYGTNGNRTISRYQTLARVGGGFNYIDGNKTPIYTQYISSLASSNLKWESTTGINAGLDYSLFNQRVSGSIDYYNNNTFDLLYNVDIPSISRFQTVPDNLGKLHNHGLELSISSINIDKNIFRWNSRVVFSRNRNELKELLGFDNDGDGKEDDLVAEGLFIGEPLSSIYTYYTSGDLWQLEDDIPSTAALGSYIIKDINKDGVINADDRMIIGYSDPSFRFSIDNKFSYGNWMLSIFINSIQGSDKFYLGSDDLNTFSTRGSTEWENRSFPRGLDFWLPENPNARYKRIGADVTSSLDASRYVQRSFIRLQNVNLSYNFSNKFLNKLQIENLRVYFNGRNLVTLTNWPGWDPETGQNIQADGRPVVKSYAFGIDVKF